MVLIDCDNCDNNEFHINWWPPNNAEAVCTNCESTYAIGSIDNAEEVEG